MQKVIRKIDQALGQKLPSLS